MQNFEMIPVSEGEYSTLLGMNGGCPESPDGKRLVYAKKQKIDGTDDTTELWICDIDLTNYKKVYEVKCGNHNGPSATFVDNSCIVFRSKDENGNGCFLVLDVDTLEVVHGPIVAKESHCAENGKYPFSVTEWHLDKNPIYPEIDSAGVYELELETGNINKLFNSDIIPEYISSIGYTPNQWTTNMSHVQFNHSATSVMMRLSVDECPRFGALGCVDLQTGDQFLIPNKPVHQLWFDDETYMAAYQEHDGERYIMETSRIKRYTRDGEVVEVLGGIGNHIDGSPDRQWFAGDSAYPGEDISVHLYKRGEVEPTATLHTHSFHDVTWELKVHPNPSFSRDGKRVYFNCPVSENKTMAVYVDISKIIK